MFITDVITLDLAVISKKHSSAIEDNFITSAKPSTVQPYAGTGMTISNSSTNWGTSKAFVKFLDSGLPLIDSSYYVTKAYFSVMTKSAPTTAASILLKEVLGTMHRISRRWFCSMVLPTPTCTTCSATSLRWLTQTAAR